MQYVGYLQPQYKICSSLQYIDYALFLQLQHKIFEKIQVGNEAVTKETKFLKNLQLILFVD